MQSPDYYDILGVARSATVEDVHAAYRRAAKGVHPDTGGTSGLFRLLKEASDTLTDPARRRDYDRTLDGAAPPPPAPAPAPRPEPRFTNYPTYVSPGEPSDDPQDPAPDAAAPSTQRRASRDPAPWTRQFDIFRPTRIDLLTVGLALAMLARHFIVAAQPGAGPPGQSLLGRIPGLGFLLGPAPDPGLAVIDAFVLYIAPAMVLSRMMVTPLLARAHRHGRAVYVVSAIALGLVTAAILWTPITWIVLLGMYATYWALRAAWHVLRFFYT